MLRILFSIVVTGYLVTSYPQLTQYQSVTSSVMLFGIIYFVTALTYIVFFKHTD